MDLKRSFKHGCLTLIAVTVVAVVACGQASSPTPTPAPVQAPVQAPAQDSAPSASSAQPESPTAMAPEPTAIAPTPPPAMRPTPAPTSTPVPMGTVSARDSIRLVIAAEPVTVDPFGYVGGTSSSVVKDNMVDSLTWQSGDDLRIVPTPASTGWEQLAPDRWRFTLREGGHLPQRRGMECPGSLAFPGLPGSVNQRKLQLRVHRRAHLGGGGRLHHRHYLRTTLSHLPQTLLSSSASPLPASSRTQQRTNAPCETVGFGPYRQTEWSHGVSITMEAFDDYVSRRRPLRVSAPPSSAKPSGYGRAETTVMAAMVQAGGSRHSLGCGG